MRQPVGPGVGVGELVLSLDTHPASQSCSCSAWNTVKDVTDVSSSLGQCQMMSAFPSALHQDLSSLCLTH